jgi:hypothetical protein
MTARQVRQLIGGLIVGSLILLGFGPVPQAFAVPNHYAPSIGTVTGTSVSGATGVPSYIRTSKPCPTGTTSVNGFWNSTDAGIVDGVIISTNSTDIGSINTSGGMPLNSNFVVMAQDAGRTLVNGRYDISIVCYPDPFSVPTAQFDGILLVSGGATPTALGTTYTWEVPGAVTTTTSLSVSPPGGGTADQPVILTATLTPASAAGSVQFTDTVAAASVDLGAPVSVVGGVATLTTTALTAGSHTLQAVFTPVDPAGFTPSSSSALPYAVLTAGQQATTTTLSVPSGTATQGASVVLTATVTPSGVAGTVTFADGTAVLGQVAVDNGKATLTVGTLTVGTHSLTARLAPSDGVAFAASASTAVGIIILDKNSFLGLLKVDGSGGSLATDGITFQAPAACPSGAGAVSVRVTGPGAWAGGLPADPAAVTGFFDAPGSAVKILGRLGEPAIEPGAYYFLVTCQDPTGTETFGFFVGVVWFYDSGNWLSRDPAEVGIPTRTTVTVTPADRVEVGRQTTVSASLNRTEATGTIVFTGQSNGSNDVLGTVPVKAGKAVLTTTKLMFGLYYVTATYTPPPAATGVKFNSSVSDEVVLAVTRVGPPVPTRAAAVTGTPKVGATLTCASGFTGATELTYLWLRDRSAIPGAGAVRYTGVAADRGHLLQCRAVASNAGGTVYRQSPAVRVAS